MDDEKREKRRREREENVHIFNLEWEECVCDI